MNVLRSGREDDPAWTASAPTEAVFFAPVCVAACRLSSNEIDMPTQKKGLGGDRGRPEGKKIRH